MIAPDPALAGPRPSAPPREAARAAEPERPSGGDFDSVLKEPAAEKEADRGAGESRGCARVPMPLRLLPKQPWRLR